MIHKTAIIDSKAKIASNVEIGPYCVIGPNVEIGENTIIHSHVNISVNAKIGKENKIYPFVSINDPQDLKYNGEPTNLVIGDNNKIREYVTINPGTINGGGKTVIGNNCLFMISSHIAHDCEVGNNVIIANNVPLGGHVIIEDNVVIGGNSAVQQFTRIGKMAMIGGMTGVLNDVIPYGLSTGNRNSLQGLNLIGLRRAKFENKDILGLSEAYKKIFGTKNINENISKLNGSFQENPLVKDVINFITKDKKRSICTPFSKLVFLTLSLIKLLFSSVA
ncbi:acyl-ACP--UDP-N-acetylglucosamine O-acyltransferase [Candidatus Pelagibacter sp.]|nr:acyl-ACP--UDP-N-acetylglucosamine O-acyltransferase [Candidatus Pelagibacter sp.]